MLEDGVDDAAHDQSRDPHRNLGLGMHRNHLGIHGPPVPLDQFGQLIVTGTFGVNGQVPVG